MPALPLVAVPHPLAGNARALVRAKAGAVAQEVLQALTDPAATLTVRYERRFLGLTERRLEAGAVCIDTVCTVDPVIAPGRRDPAAGDS